MRFSRPPALANDGARLRNYRLLLARLLALWLPLVLVFVVLPVLLVARFVFHAPLPDKLLEGTFIAALATRAAVELLRVRDIFRYQTWKALDGRTVLRADQPRRFWIWASCHMLMAAIWLAVTGFLAWTLLLE